ncbi:MAG: hypothetical protein KY464_09895 [Gemmatimonadetes bacterium]|nr:hypothetical protein [Gemmatimonadota bacterium]
MAWTTRCWRTWWASSKDPDGFRAKVRQLYESPEAHSFDVLEFRDGRLFERYSQPQRVGAEVVGRVWSFRHVTEARRAEAELLRRESQLARTEQIAGLCRIPPRSSARTRGKVGSTGP